jgi:DNA-binding MarR family transcriptional regulator
MNDLQSFGVEVGTGKYDEEAFYMMVLVYTILFDRMAKFLDPFELTPAKMNVLMVIKHQGGKEGLMQKEIGKRLLVTASNMTRMLDKLEREKLIERVAQAGDKRVNIIRISPRGSKLLDDVWPGYLKTMKAGMGALSKENQRILSGIMSQWFLDLKK